VAGRSKKRLRNGRLQRWVCTGCCEADRHERSCSHTGGAHAEHGRRPDGRPTDASSPNPHVHSHNATTVASQIDTLLPDGGEVIILGGPAAIHPDTQTAIEQAGHTTTRLSGPTRVETAIVIANDVLDRFGAPDDVGIARSHTITDDPTAAWADTVAAGGWAALTHSPILLNPTDQPHPAVAAWLDTNQPATRTVLGGTAAIPPDTAQALGATPTTTLAPPIKDATCRTADRAPVTILGPTTVISHDVADAFTQPCSGSDSWM